MNDAEYEEQKDRIKAIYDRWDQVLGLRWWTVKQVWVRDLDGFQSESNGHTSFIVHARTTASWPYMTATISFNLVDMANLDDKDAERVVVHELCHILVNEMRYDETVSGLAHGENGRMHEERVVTTLAQAFLRVRNMDRPDIEQVRE